MRPLNVVIVNSELPYPPTAGNRIRTLNLMERLAGRHRITFIARRNTDGDREADAAAEYLRGRGIAVRLVDRPVPKKSGPGFYGRLALNLASPLPYSVASHSSPAVRAAVREHAEQHAVDLWQAESIGYLEVLKDVPDDRKIAIAHNVESLIWQRSYESEKNPLRRWYIGRQWRKFQRFERRAFAAVKRVVAVSDQDARLMRERFDAPRVEVVDNGIDRASYEGVRPSRQGHAILFLGTFEWRPNLDAARALLETIFPAVRAAVPGAALLLVGRRPPPWLGQRVAATPGAELHGDVPDVRPFLARSRVMAVPLRIGSGSRLKILEALAAGLPVVSTAVGAEGLELEPGRHYVRADGSPAMAEALIALLRDPAPAEAMADAARPFVLSRYDWDTLAGRLERLWYDCIAAPAPEPAVARSLG